MIFIFNFSYIQSEFNAYCKVVRTLSVLSHTKIFVSSCCYQTFWYIIASFSRSLVLNPSLWPISAFGSCSINTH